MKATKIIMDTTRKVVGKVTNSVSKHSPTILIIAGAVGVVGGVVLAIKAGKESDAKTRQAREELDIVHQYKSKITEEVEIVADGETGEEKRFVYSRMDYAKDLTHAYANLLFVYAKVYGPAALTTVFSLFLIFTSHRILTKRYAITYASLATMTKAYDAYRKNVIAAEGFDADERYRFGIKAVEEERPLLDKEGNPKLDKNGNPKTIKERYDVINGDIIDPRSVLWDSVTAYGRFDDTSSDDYVRWKNNVSVVMAAQEAANNIMHARSKDPRNDGIGYIYLNEVLNQLGMKPIDIGQIVGWRYDPRFDMTDSRYDPYYDTPENRANWGDNKVDFAIEDPTVPGYEGRQRFKNGDEEAILLFMNYDGIINNKIGLKSIKFNRR